MELNQEINQEVNDIKREVGKFLSSLLFYLCIILSCVSVAFFFGSKMQMEWLYLLVGSIFGTAFFSVFSMWATYLDKKLTKMEEEERQKASTQKESSTTSA